MKIESAILRRLGPIPLWRGERRCLDALDEIYRRAMDRASRSASRSAGLTSARKKGYTTRQFRLDRANLDCPNGKDK